MSAQRGAAGIESVRNLKPGWDSYEADEITPQAIEAAARFMEMIRTSAPFVVPTVNGGIQLEWHEQGIDCEIEIDENGVVQPWEESTPEMAPRT